MPVTERLYNVKRILELYEKLDRESLVAQELEELVQLSNELYEKALILRFKAAEERIFGPNGEKNSAQSSTVESNEPESTIGEIDFSIFEKVEENEEEKMVESELTEEVSQTEPEVEAPMFQLQDENEIDDSSETEAKIQKEIVNEEEELPEPEVIIKNEVKENTNQWTSFFEKVLKDHASGLQTPLSSLAGSFGLNERILYINELFDGEAEAFSNLIQKMDKIGDWQSCQETLSYVAEESSWEMDNDVTGEFILHVKRRYA